MLLVLVGSASVSNDAVSMLATKHDVGERTVRLDLEAIRQELSDELAEVLPRDLLEAIQSAKSFGLLKTLGERVMLEMVQGTITRELGQALNDVLREQRHTLRAMREEQGHTALRAIEVLTPQELEALRKYRESVVPRALKPGEFPAPPSDAGPQQPPREASASEGSAQ